MLGIERKRNQTEKGPFKDSIIPKEKVAELQELFNEAIPRIFERIKNENVTHILLTEKTARLFKVGFQRTLKKVGLDQVKVGSFAADYLWKLYKLSNECGLGIKQEKKKLNFLPKDKESEYKIMIIDEYESTGKTSRAMFNGLEDLGFTADKIITEPIQRRSIYFEDDIMMQAIYNNKEKIFEDRDMQSIYHTTLINKNSIKKYRDTIEQISDIMLEAVKK